MSINYHEEEEFEAKFNGKVMLRLLGLLKNHWPMMAGVIISIAATAGIDSLFTYLSSLLVDKGILANDLNYVTNILIRYAGLMLVQSVSVFGFIFLVGFVGERVQYDLRKSLFGHLQRLSLSYYSITPVGWIMSRVTSDVERVSNLLTWGVVDSLWGLMNISTATYFMFRINWRMAIFVILSLPVLIFVAIKFRTRILRQYRLVRKQNSKITGAVNEMITGVRVIKALNREDKSLSEFSEETDGMYKAAYRAAWLSALFLPSVQLISSFVFAGVIYYAGWNFGNAAFGMSIGGIQAFLSYVTFMMWPIFDLARVFAEMQLAIASAERIFSLVDSVPSIQDRSNAYDPGSIHGDISFKNVTFWYDDDEEKQPVLKNFSLDVKDGETIALVGPTGGGKTTTVNLISRFYEPKEGTITIGGKDYTEYSLHSIQSRIGIVLQTPHLFSGTIRDNIRYGRLNAAEEDILEAAHLAGAHDFIMKLPKQYDEQVGEGGSLLSVGQKQLISLARAILAKPEIFIMDEATSSVDTLTEALIQKAMDRLLATSTSFVIAHRLSTIRNADRILVIEDGQIAEMGTHADLLKRRGKYFQLYTKQFRTQMEATYDPFLEKDTVSVQA